MKAYESNASSDYERQYSTLKIQADSDTFRVLLDAFMCFAEVSPLTVEREVQVCVLRDRLKALDPLQSKRDTQANLFPNGLRPPFLYGLATEDTFLEPLEPDQPRVPVQNNQYVQITEMRASAQPDSRSPSRAVAPLTISTARSPSPPPSSLPRSTSGLSETSASAAQARTLIGHVCFREPNREGALVSRSGVVPLTGVARVPQLGHIRHLFDSRADKLLPGLEKELRKLFADRVKQFEGRAVFTPCGPGIIISERPDATVVQLAFGVGYFDKSAIEKASMPASALELMRHVIEQCKAFDPYHHDRGDFGIPRMNKELAEYEKERAALRARWTEAQQKLQSVREKWNSRLSALRSPVALSDTLTLSGACLAGKAEQAKQLLNGIKRSKDRAAAVNSVDELGYAPLHLACQSGHLELITFLLDCGGDPSLPCKSDSGSPAAMEVLLEFYCAAKLGESKIKDKASSDAMTLRAHHTQVFLNAPGFNDRTAIHTALYFRQELCVKWLVDRGCDLSARDTSYGEVPLHVAARRLDLGSTELLLAAGANPLQHSTHRNQYGATETPLYTAMCAYPNREIVRAYLDKGVFLPAELLAHLMESAAPAGPRDDRDGRFFEGLQMMSAALTERLDLIDRALSTSGGGSDRKAALKVLSRSADSQRLEEKEDKHSSARVSASGSPASASSGSAPSSAASSLPTPQSTPSTASADSAERERDRHMPLRGSPPASDTASGANIELIRSTTSSSTSSTRDVFGDLLAWGRPTR